MNGADRFRVPGAPGLYLVKTDQSVFAYLRYDNALFAGAGASVLEAVSDVFSAALPSRTIPSEVLLVLPTLDEVATAQGFS